MSQAELITRRKVSREWRDEINHILQECTKNLFLLSDRYNVSQYTHVLNRLGLNRDINYAIPKTCHSFTNLALLVTDIKKMMNQQNGLLSRLLLVNRLVFFGEPNVVDNEMTSPSWHSFLNEIVSRFPSLKTLVIQHYGYFPGYDKFYHNRQVYGKLFQIIIIQPSKYEEHRAFATHQSGTIDSAPVDTSGFFTYRNGFGVNQRPSVTLASNREPTGRTHSSVTVYMFKLVMQTHGNIGVGSIAPLPIERYE